MSESLHYGVPSAPNESLIFGRVVKVEPAPEGMGLAWEIEVYQSVVVNTSHSFAPAPRGEIVTIFAHPKFKENAAPNDIVEARVYYEGDEYGGAFFLLDEIRKL